MVQNWHIKMASRSLTSGGVIAYPTEAVWGLGCDPFNESALQTLLDLKQRPWQKGMILVASHLDQLDDWILPLTASDQSQILSATEPTSWLLPCRPVSPLLCGTHRTLAIRISDHPVVRALTEAAGPLVSTSANPAGRTPARSALSVRRYFGDLVDYLVPGELGGRTNPSQIRTLRGHRLR